MDGCDRLLRVVVAVVFAGAAFVPADNASGADGDPCGQTVRYIPDGSTFGMAVKTGVRSGSSCVCPAGKYAANPAQHSSVLLCLPPVGGVTPERAAAILTACDAIPGRRTGASRNSDENNRYYATGSGAMEFYAQRCEIHLDNEEIAPPPGEGQGVNLGDRYDGCLIGAESGFKDRMPQLPHFGNGARETDNALARRPDCVDVVPGLRDGSAGFPTGYSGLDDEDPAYAYGARADPIDQCAPNNGKGPCHPDATCLDAQKDPPVENPDADLCACPASAPIGNGVGPNGCVPPGDERCYSKGWTSGTDVVTTKPLCNIHIQRLHSDGTPPDAPSPKCVYEGDCAFAFGDPPVFPQMTAGGEGTENNPALYCATAGHIVNRAGDACVASCPQNERAGGTAPRRRCELTCPVGQSPIVGGPMANACVADAQHPDVQACSNANWGLVKDSPSSWKCQVKIRDGASDTPAEFCRIGTGDGTSCESVFGDPPVFPAGPSAGTGFVYNCGTGYESATVNVGGAKTCVNVNECAAGTHTCGGNACADRDPSSGNLFVCAPDIVCENGGTRVTLNNTCDCSTATANSAGASGWGGDTCEDDVDECQSDETNNCDANATCTNNNGDFSCACNEPDYSGNGRTCAPNTVDECETRAGECHELASCDDPDEAPSAVNTAAELCGCVDTSHGGDGAQAGSGCVPPAGTACGFENTGRSDGAECACPAGTYDANPGADAFANDDATGQHCIAPVGGVSSERAAAILSACAAVSDSRIYQSGDKWAQRCDIKLDNLNVFEGPGDAYDGCLVGADAGFSDRLPGGLRESDNALNRRPNCVDVIPNLRNAGGAFPDGHYSPTDSPLEYGTRPDPVNECEVNNPCHPQATCNDPRRDPPFDDPDADLCACPSNLPVGDGVGPNGCVPNGDARCYSKGWTSGFNVSGIAYCDIHIRLLYSDGTPAAAAISRCHYSGLECNKAFGDPPVFPQMTAGGEGTANNPALYCDEDGHFVNRAGDACAASCPQGETPGGVAPRRRCQPLCPQGQSPLVGGPRANECVADAQHSNAQACSDAEWLLEKDSPSSWRCRIKIRAGATPGTGEADECRIGSGGGTACESVFGDPPSFPQKRAGTDNRRFVYNCGNGRTSAALNQNDETECADINECAPNNGKGPCDINATCANADRSGDPPECDCNPGFSGTGLSCDPDRTVNLRPGANGALSAKWSGDGDVRDGEKVPHGTRVTFVADPDDGFYVSGWTGCNSQNIGGHSDGRNKECAAVANAGLNVGAAFTNINECETARNDCRALADCRDDADNPGANPICECKSGYAGDGRTKCDDINECETGAAMCRDNEKCRNLAGSYECDAFPELRMIVPAGEVFRASPASGTACRIWKWTKSCKNATASESDCTPNGEGLVTVGVVFDCGN